MARSKANKAPKVDRREPVHQPASPIQDEVQEDSDVDVADADDQESDGSELEKDAAEEELEHLVFGDSAGFREGLRDFGLTEEEEFETEEGAGNDTTDLAGLDDAALFFTDTGDDENAYQPPAKTDDSDDDDVAQMRQPAAWEDSDDERMLISLNSVPRLRKLRQTEAEDVITGKDYARRLRRQFEMLNPAPEWARQAMGKPAAKRRRLSEGAGSSAEEFSGDEMDMDGEVDPVQPLAQLLQDAESLVRQSGPGTGKKRKLRPEVIEIQRTKDIAGTQPSAVTSLSFHPQLPLLLSSGPSSTLYLHQLASSPPAPTPNPLLTSLHIRNTPLTTTAFHPNDSRIFLSARRRYFHIWNLQTGQVEKISRVYGHQHEQKTMETFKLSPDGNYMALQGSARKGGGVVNILSATSLQWLSQARIESRGGIADFAWWRDSAGIAIVGKGGEVTEWSVHSQTAVARWQDEGAVGTTVLALGGHNGINKAACGTDRWVAVGSSSGIVNIYDRKAWLTDSNDNRTKKNRTDQPIPSHPKPARVLDHLTTPTSHLTFSPDGQLLAMASKWKRDAMRLVHLPSCTVFKNWPTSSTPLGRITSVAIAEGGVVAEGGGGKGDAEGDVFAVLAVGNEQGKVRVWEVR
ncbi:hypothetical protein MBLNU230_g5825t1 [Neophaeotheca triangularis]